MFEIKNKEFYMDGKPFKIYSGAMHYFRTVPEYWEDRLTKLKLAGFNAVETYTCWNLHEPKPGEFNFDGILDIERFVKTAQKVGLYCIVRPGPYICAEWDFGGLPAWLLKDKNMQIRCMYPDFLTCIERYYKELLGRLKPLLQTNGGNIIAMQVENEYGSFGRDKKYLYWLRDLVKNLGVDVQLFKLRHVFRVRTHCQKPCMHDGMERFYSTIQTFGKAREFANTDNGKPCVFQGFRRTARRNDFVIASD